MQALESCIEKTSSTIMSSGNSARTQASIDLHPTSVQDPATQAGHSSLLLQLGCGSDKGAVSEDFDDDYNDLWFLVPDFSTIRGLEKENYDHSANGLRPETMVAKA